KGARRSQRRFGSALDLFAQGSAQLSTRTGRDLDTLAGFDVVASRAALAEDLGRFAGAAAIAELVLPFQSDHADPALFDALAATLDAIAAAPPSRAVDAALAGAWRVIGALGFAPALAECAECNAPLDDEAPALFSHAAGGLLCERCARLAPGGRRMPGEARRALQAWSRGGEADPLDAPAARAHLRLLREFLLHHVVDGRPLRAFELWERQSTGSGA
ncbi:MAG: DNA repair protein RecO, partial [Gemmatimonadota bacterium]|nr:DNA repair protein RecO [Gemmatimonadota bacterium]